MRVPVAGTKVEGELGRTITVSAQDPIDFVRVKSGVDAVVVSARFDTNQGQITLSKDISSYVVCTSAPTPPPPTTPPTTSSPTSTTSPVGITSTTSAVETTATSP
jgi:hypothetical protein